VIPALIAFFMALALWREVQPDQLSPHREPIKTLKRVSGQLLKLLGVPEKAPPPAEALPHLLVVDDEESICFSMQEYFSHKGFIVDIAKEIEEAERLITNSKYNVIIQDLSMGPIKNSAGLEIIRLAHEHSPETRIIVLTAYGSTEIEIEAKRSGADVFLRKPQPLSQVAQVVRGLIESPRRWATPGRASH